MSKYLVVLFGGIIFEILVIYFLKIVNQLLILLLNNNVIYLLIFINIDPYFLESQG